MLSRVTRRHTCIAVIFCALGLAISHLIFSTSIEHARETVGAVHARFTTWYKGYLPGPIDKGSTISAAGNPGADSREPHVEASKPCKRTLLYRFAGAHGFASEYLIFLRVVVLARAYNYQVLIDDSVWNYGAWTEYVLRAHRPSTTLTAADGL